MTDERRTDDAAARHAPPVGDHEFLGRDGVPLRLRGRLLGFASSEREHHLHSVASVDRARRSDAHAERHPPSFAPPGVRCPACRWFEVRIISVDAELAGDCTCDGYAARSGELVSPRRPSEHDPACGAEPARARYLVLTYGRTTVPGELDKRRAEWTDSPYTVVELLTQRRRDDSFIPTTSARALSEAAAFDDGICDAYVNRAVA